MTNPLEHAISPFRWGRNQVGASVDEQLLKDKLKDVISKIRYTNMTPMEFTKVVVPTGLLSAEENLSVYSYLCGDEATRLLDHLLLPSMEILPEKLALKIIQRLVGLQEKFKD